MRKRHYCDRCNIEKPVYNVVAPLCLDAITIGLCPGCFQVGIDNGEIVWLGNAPYGVCSEHLSHEAA